MPLPLLILVPIAVPVALATLTGVAVHAHSSLTNAKITDPLIRELPQAGLTACTLRPQFRTNNKLLNVFSRTGVKMFRFVRHQPSPDVHGITYSLLDGRDAHPLSTIHIEGLKSEVLFHGSDETLQNLGLVSIRHVVEGDDHFRMFILPDGHTYQWTGKTRFLERVIDRSGTLDTEVRERIGAARRIGTRIWEIKFDERQLPAEVVFSTAIVSILDQWNTIFGVGGIFLKSDKNLTVKFQT
ncbi:hypothetical protein POJ06DRAFT_263878 [Lipomyces tetrasporus]|uniref:Phospholipid scramblase n=1 Tax=Lipomyces tetrasporus TaxID=54092 RepID=A0AAD7VPX6_9ASCO|nr:uncharacterized protein POJ06DRAFT_263878 [Lipomyces tetrasporus]KAJ8096565.1 hypothetical protein POJ06DRAFT_263878 [Lipomyces tetrasporus]